MFADETLLMAFPQISVCPKNFGLILELMDNIMQLGVVCYATLAVDMYVVLSAGFWFLYFNCCCCLAEWQETI